VSTGPARVRLDDGSEREADVLIMATPAPVTAALLEPLAPDVARGVATIRHVSSATVSLGFRREDVPHPLNGTGFVIATGEPTRILGCTWSSIKFAGRAPEGHVLLRAFVGGAQREADAALGDAAIVALVRADLERILGITAEPVIRRIFRWLHANPQYEVGHAARIAAIDAACPPGLKLVGGAYHGIGVPDCVRWGQVVAEAVLGG
jgi:oxygen-dependent protoporphyrinogen oxidase